MSGIASIRQATVDGNTHRFTEGKDRATRTAFSTLDLLLVRPQGNKAPLDEASQTLYCVGQEEMEDGTHKCVHINGSGMCLES